MPQWRRRVWLWRSRNFWLIFHLVEREAHGVRGTPVSDTSEQDEEVAADPRLERVPEGAMALAGIAVGLLLLAWLLIYFFVFLPRGSVG
jgi:hypothetical protein